MKDLKVPIAIIIAALLIASAIIFNSYNDPLTRCVDRLLESGQITGSKKIIKATVICNETGN